MGTSIDDRLPNDQWHRLESRLVSTTAQEVPGWTGDNDGDPGLSIIELFAFVAEQLIWRANAIPAHGRSRLLEVTEKLASLSGGRDATGRTVFVSGQQWTQANSLADAGPADRVFTVTEDGTVVFGDGQHGANPSESTVSVTYRHGGGAAGDVGDARLSVTMPWPPRASHHEVVVDPSRGVRIARCGRQ